MQALAEVPDVQAEVPDIPQALAEVPGAPASQRQAAARTAQDGRADRDKDQEPDRAVLRRAEVERTGHDPDRAEVGRMGLDVLLAVREHEEGQVDQEARADQQGAHEDVHLEVEFARVSVRVRVVAHTDLA